MTTALLTALLFVLPLQPVAAAAPAAPRVVVLQASGQRDQSGFVEALRIQLAGTGQVVAGAPLDDGPLPTRVAAAGDAARAAGALLAVWLERAPVAGGEDVVLYVVGDADGRAVVQVFRLPEGSPADTDRALALKVGSVVDELLAPAARVVLTPAHAEKTPAPAAAPPAGPPASPMHVVVGVETRVTTGAGDRGVAGEAGLFVGGGRRGILQGEVRVGSGDRWSNAAGEVRTREITAAASYRWAIDPWGIGVRLDLGMHIVAADGTSVAGGTGSGIATPFFLGFALEHRFPVGTVDLVVGLGAELAVESHTFELNQQAVAETGFSRGFLSLSAQWRGP